MTGNEVVQPMLLENGEVPEPTYPPRMQKWLRLCNENTYLRVLVDRWGNETPPPPPMTREELLAFLGSLHHEPHRQLLQELLLELLADGIVEIVLALRGEVPG